MQKIPPKKGSEDIPSEPKKKKILLLQKPPNLAIWLITLIGIIATVIIMQIMAPIEAELKSATPYGVMELEFMWTAAQARLITDTWGSTLISRELFVTYVDFAYMPAYAIAFSGVTLIFTRLIKNRAKKTPDGFLTMNRMANTGCYITIFPWIAIIFDAIENLNIIIILKNPQHINWVNPLLTSLCASIKFAFLAGSLLFIIAGFFVLLFINLKKLLKM